jgi:hypothetical protein
VHLHSRRYNDRNQLSYHHGSLANNVATEDLARPAIDDQFAEAGRPPIDDGARCRVEAYLCDNDFTLFTSLRLRHANLDAVYMRTLVLEPA